ncbi:Protein MB21D2 [Stylophora pistillata]|uniref:Protein MB21D2 n=1 Tax=Stylophora pistillata TaxID=50429 RepID=A0A2B4RQJ2_STYPI|nr:Protein MB21D2 [Stylophora pistillata]
MMTNVYSAKCPTTEVETRTTHSSYSSSVSSFLSSVLRYRYVYRDHRLSSIQLLEELLNTLSLGQLGWKYVGTESTSEGHIEALGDIDNMWVDPGVQVVFENHTVTERKGRDVHLLTAKSFDHPGFYRLFNESGELPKYYKQCEDQVSEGLAYISSEMFMITMFKMLTAVIDAESHKGPAIQRPALSQIHMKTDNVFALYCPEWPDFVRQVRFKNSKWPCGKALQQLARAGCHVVPIGKHNSSTKSLEWRLSFSSAEKIIMHSLINSTQLYTYNMLKLLLSHLMKEYKVVDEVLCTYYIKTVFFFAIEEEPECSWKESALLDCIHLVKSRLCNCLRNQLLRNFFVPENNMIQHLPFQSCSEVADLIHNRILSKLDIVLIHLVKLGTVALEEHNCLAKLTSLPEMTDYSDGGSSESISQTMIEALRNLSPAIEEHFLTTVESTFCEGSMLSRDRYRMQIRNDLQNFLDPVFYNTLPAQLSLRKLEQGLLPFIDHVPTLFPAPTANCFVQILYRACGNVCHQASQVAELDREKQMWQDKAECYYQRGRYVVYNDGFDDRGFSGTVHLMQFYYLNGNFDACFQQIISIQEFLNFDSFEEVKDICRYGVLTEICNPVHLPQLMKTDPSLHKYFSSLKSGDSKFINSMAFAYYMSIKVTQKREQGKWPESLIRSDLAFEWQQGWR